MFEDELLAAPGGRALCWNLLRWSSSGRIWDGPDRIDEIKVRDAAERLRDVASIEDWIFDALRHTVGTARYWQEPDEEDARSRLDPRLLAPVAEVITAQSATEWWATALDRGQVTLLRLGHGEADEPPSLRDGRSSLLEWRAGEHRAGEAHREFAATHGDQWHSLTGHWWTTPWVASPATTRVLDNDGPVGLWFVEDSLGWDRVGAWPVEPTREPRVLEIHDAAAWRELVSVYPFDVTDSRGPDWYRALGRRGRWLIPDWASVADDFDAVHVSVAGYLSASGAVISVDAERATTLAGWSPDETYWLNDVVAVSGEPTYWNRIEGDDGWEPAR